MLCRGILAVAALLLAAGCDWRLTLSEQEAIERSTSLYRNAIDDLQAGRVDAAIKGFERVVFYEPKSYSAHFQLATLLQDVRKDYISAISHSSRATSKRPAARSPASKARPSGAASCLRSWARASRARRRRTR